MCQIIEPISETEGILKLPCQKNRDDKFDLIGLTRRTTPVDKVATPGVPGD